MLAKAPVEQEADRSREKTRIVVSFVPLNLGRFGLPHGDISPGVLTPITMHKHFVTVDHTRKATRPEDLLGPPLNAVMATHYPGELVEVISKDTTSGMFGDPGFTNIKCLIGLDSIATLKSLQAAVLPRELFYDAKGKYDPVDLHARVNAHLERVIEDNDPSHIEAMVATDCLRSSQVGAAYKEAVLRDLSDEILAGNGVKGISPIHNRWRMEIGVVLDERIRLTSALPGDRDPAQYAARAVQPVAAAIDPASLESAVMNMLAAKGLQLVPIAAVDNSATAATPPKPTSTKKG